MQYFIKSFLFLYGFTLLINASFIYKASAGNVKSFPVIGEGWTAAESAGKTIAAGACLATGNTQAAEDLLESAEQSWVQYTEKNLIAANINMGFAYYNNDVKKVAKLKKTQKEAWTEVAENTPLIGHGIAAVYLAKGNVEDAARCERKATRSGFALAATFATGGSGAVACGAATVGASTAYDGFLTAFDSMKEGEYKPQGHLAKFSKAIETHNAVDIFDAGATLVLEAAHPLPSSALFDI